MPTDDYTSTVRGGLKLKGGTKPEGITKKKKKKKAATEPSQLARALGESSAKGEDGDRDGESDGLTEEELKLLEERGGDGKTAAERAQEEMRRRRLQDRLQKEGAKTHKQRVEELNKYLSNLSEHHDMPRIGPG